MYASMQAMRMQKEMENEISIANGRYVQNGCFRSSLCNCRHLGISSHFFGAKLCRYHVGIFTQLITKCELSLKRFASSGAKVKSMKKAT